MAVTVCCAAYEEKPVLRNLLELYRYDFSEFDGGDVDDFGLFGYRYLDHYWTEPERHPFLLRVDGQLAGFALVRTGSEGSEQPAEMAEFFVLRKYRRRNVGRTAALDLFARFPGRWHVRVVPANHGAQAFWRLVIAAHSRGRYVETHNEGTGGPEILLEFVSV